MNTSLITREAFEVRYLDGNGTTLKVATFLNYNEIGLLKRLKAPVTISRIPAMIRQHYTINSSEGHSWTNHVVSLHVRRGYFTGAYYAGRTMEVTVDYGVSDFNLAADCALLLP